MRYVTGTKPLQVHKQLRREHDGAILSPFAMVDLDQHPISIYIRYPQARNFGRAQPCGIGRGQRSTGLERWYCFQKRTTSSALRIAGNFAACARTRSARKSRPDPA